MHFSSGKTVVSALGRNHKKSEENTLMLRVFEKLLEVWRSGKYPVQVRERFVLFFLSIQLWRLEDRNISPQGLGSRRLTPMSELIQTLLFIVKRHPFAESSLEWLRDNCFKGDEFLINLRFDLIGASRIREGSREHEGLLNVRDLVVAVANKAREEHLASGPDTTRLLLELYALEKRLEWIDSHVLIHETFSKAEREIIAEATGRPFNSPWANGSMKPFHREGRPRR